MIAVTGANGLLGRFIIGKLVQEKIPVTAIVRKNSARDWLTEYRDKVVVREADVLDLPALVEGLQGAASVIHAAAVVSFNPGDAKRIFAVNVGGTKNVVDVCLALGIPKIIHVSSVAALGRQKGIIEVNEESKWVAGPLNSRYGESKYLAELEIFRGMEEGLSVSVVNPSAILAPADWTKSSSQLFRYAWKESMFYTGGSLNYVDVRDVADVIYGIHVGSYNGEKFIINAGCVPIKDFLDAIAKRFNKRTPSIKVKGHWTEIVGWLEEVRSFLTRSQPLITRESARLATETFQYNSQKIMDALGFRFRSQEETLDWCCAEYLRKINTNK